MPVLVIGFRKVTTQVASARLFTLPGAPDHKRSDRKHVLQLPTGRRFELGVQGVAAPEIKCLGSLVQARRIPFNSHVSPHQTGQRVPQVYQIELFMTHGVWWVRRTE